MKLDRKYIEEAFRDNELWRESDAVVENYDIDDVALEVL